MNIETIHDADELYRRTQKKRGQPLNQDKLTAISSTLFLESTIVQFGKTYPPSLISARCCVIKDSLMFNTQRPRHNISSNIGFVLIQGLTPSFHTLAIAEKLTVLHIVSSVL